MNWKLRVGTHGSELPLDAAGSIRLTAEVAARLDEEPDARFSRKGQPREWSDRPYWHLEGARIDGTRTVPVELIVNGRPVARRVIDADGEVREVEFDVHLDRSSWIALRILPSSHTNPIFVIVEGAPIRASRRSAEWCLASLEQCWSQKSRFYDEDEMQDAIEAYDHARATYRRIISECQIE